MGHGSASAVPLRFLGATGIPVSALGFGAWAIGGQSTVPGYGPTEDEVSRKAIRAALDSGCTFFDTAGCYGAGHSESLLGEMLSTRRDEVVIATKLGVDFSGKSPRADFSRRHLPTALQDSLVRLRTEFVDVLLLHDPPPEVIADAGMGLLMRGFREAGTARSLGVSVAGIDDLPLALRQSWVEVVELPYNVLAPPEVDRWLRLAHERGIGLIAREPLLRGMMAGALQRRSYPHGDHRALWPEHIHVFLRTVGSQLERFGRPGETVSGVALRYALGSPHLSTVVVGCRTEEQVAANFACMQEIGVTPGRKERQAWT